MLEQFVAVMPGTLAPALLVMSLSVMLTVGEGRDKPISSHWRLIGLIVGLIAAIVFAGLRASAVINQRTFVNYPVLWCAIIADILTIVVVVFARRITTNWQQHKVFMHIANAVAAIDTIVNMRRYLKSKSIRSLVSSSIEDTQPSIFFSSFFFLGASFFFASAFSSLNSSKSKKLICITYFPPLIATHKLLN